MRVISIGKSRLQADAAREYLTEREAERRDKVVLTTERLHVRRGKGGCPRALGIPARQKRAGAGRPCARGWRPTGPGGFRAKTAPAASESPT
jgi:hypothetical protein